MVLAVTRLTIRSSTSAGLTEMDTALVFEPDPSEIVLGGPDSPRLQCAYERSGECIGKVSLPHEIRKLKIKHHDGADAGEKKARHRGLESMTMPHKFGRNGRVRHRKHGVFLLKRCHIHSPRSTPRITHE